MRVESGKDPPEGDPVRMKMNVMSNRQEEVIMTEKDIPQLRNKWRSKYTALFGNIPLELPPFREVNHEINLVDC